MAARQQHTTQRLQNEFLSCPRCSQPFKDPKALPCLHNLCKACLQEHIHEEMGGSRHTSFTCPVCSSKIFVPDPSKPTGVWANQFPSNFVIKGMMDTIAAGSPQATSPPGATHGQHPLAKSGDVDRQGAPSSPSSQHRDGAAKDGRSVGLAGTAGSGSLDLSSHPEVGEVWRKLSELRSSVQTEESGVVNCLTTLSRQRGDQERAMTDTVSKLQEIIAMRKTELLENLSTCFSDEVEKLRQRVQSCKDHLQSLRSCEDLLRTVASLPESSDIASDLLESVNLQLEEVQYRPKQENPARVVLEYDATSVYKVMEALASFGSVRVEKEASGPRPAAAVQQPTPSGPQSTAARGDSPGSTHHGDKDCLPSYSAVARVPGSSAPQLVEKVTPGQLVKDGVGTQIYDITVTSAGTIVMTAYEEKIVQAFHAPKIQGGVKTRSFLGRVQLDTQPRCLCTLTQGYVAVVGDMCLYLIAVLTDRLELKRTIPTGKSYTGISAYGESTLVVSCQNPVSVDFVGLNGFINETLDKDRASGQLLFKAPHFMTTSRKDGLLFVTDRTRLVCLNNAGKVKYVFPKADGEPLSHAEGVCCDPAGYVYLVDRGKRHVIALSARGTRIADVITEEHGLTDPCAVALDDQGLVYVTNDFMEVLVFRVC